MDVYLPRDKVNRAEHRGFGFVTFETEAAVLRIHAHGQHQIKCAAHCATCLCACMQGMLPPTCRWYCECASMVHAALDMPILGLSHLHAVSRFTPASGARVP
jgi:hypothetical protein